MCSALVLSVSEATAQVYDVKGTHTPLGRFTSEITVEEQEDGTYAVTLHTQFSSPDIAARGELHQRGQGTRRGNVLTIAPLTTVRGLAGAIEPSAQLQSSAKLTFLSDGELVVVGQDPAGSSSASGRLRGAADPDARSHDARSHDAHRLRDKLRQEGRHLVALAKRELEKLAYDGEDISKTFKISDYFHVGVSGGVRLIDPATLTPEMRLGSQSVTRPVWIANEVEGGVRIPLSTSIPLGEVTLGLGFDARAKVNYEVVDVYVRPEGITDEVLRYDLRTMGKRSFDLPLDAEDADAMTVGARRVMEGEASVAIRGDFRVGHEISDLGDVVRIGASARLGGFYRIKGVMRVTATRLSGDAIRVRVTRGTLRTRQVSADLLLGATVDTDALAEDFKPGLEFIHPEFLRDVAADEAADAAESLIKDVLRFQITARRTHDIEDEIDVSFRFDLTRDAARKAYERAIRGDLTRAADLSSDPEAGVRAEFRVFEAEDRAYLGAHLKLSVLLRAGASRRVSLSELDVDDAANGKTHFDIFRFNRRRGHTWFGGHGDRNRDMSLELIRETSEDGAVRRSLRYVLDIKAPHTTLTDSLRFARLLRGLGLDDSSGLPTPERRLFRSRYGKTRSSLIVEIGEAGLAKIMAASHSQAFQAYVDAHTIVTGEVPIWASEAGRRKIDHPSEEDYDSERSELWRAKRFVKNLAALGIGTDAKSRAKHLEKLAKSAGYRLKVITALVQLAPRETVSIRANMAGERINVRDGETGEGFETVRFHDPQ